MLASRVLENPKIFSPSYDNPILSVSCILIKKIYIKKKHTLFEMFHFAQVYMLKAIKDSTFFKLNYFLFIFRLLNHH